MEEGNGLPNFYVDMDRPGNLIKPIQYFFLPSKIDLRDNPRNDDAKNQVDNVGAEEDVDATLTGETIL